VVESAALFDVARERALMAGAALECVHCYSLVHDDLPAMDNDDLRRGRPTAHKAFDDATAILAGDSLLTYAFDILSRPETHTRSKRARAWGTRRSTRAYTPSSAPLKSRASSPVKIGSRSHRGGASVTAMRRR